jgi:RimJ/RimL family protein N-acetyltransferase
MRGRGIGREAVELFTDSLLDEGIERVQASTALDNASMRRVLEHLGFAFEGVLRDFAPGPEGGREDYALYSLTRRDRRR